MASQIGQILFLGLYSAGWFVGGAIFSTAALNNAAFVRFLETNPIAANWAEAIAGAAAVAVAIWVPFEIDRRARLREDEQSIIAGRSVAIEIFPWLKAYGDELQKLLGEWNRWTHVIALNNPDNRLLPDRIAVVDFPHLDSLPRLGRAAHAVYDVIATSDLAARPFHTMTRIARGEIQATEEQFEHVREGAKRMLELLVERNDRARIAVEFMTHGHDPSLVLGR